MMLGNGSRVNYLEAQIIGGAHNPVVSSKNIGLENVKVALQILTKEQAVLTSEDVGGEKSRKIIFNTADNEIAVLKMTNLRQSDWFPYSGYR